VSRYEELRNMPDPQEAYATKKLRKRFFLFPGYDHLLASRISDKTNQRSRTKSSEKASFFNCKQGYYRRPCACKRSRKSKLHL
jgi:hypothetical protein